MSDLVYRLRERIDFLLDSRERTARQRDEARERAQRWQRIAWQQRRRAEKWRDLALRRGLASPPSRGRR
jgi:hypothetical protein